MKKYFWIIIAVIIVAIIVGGFFLWRYWKNRKMANQQPSSISTSGIESTPSTSSNSIPSSSITLAPTLMDKLKLYWLPIPLISFAALVMIAALIFKVILPRIKARKAKTQ